MQVNAKKPGTYYIKFLHEYPKKFQLTNENGTVELIRFLDRKTPRIKFNLPIPGDYYGNVPFEVVNVTDLEIPDNLPSLPEQERNREKPFYVVDNFSLTGTPARIFTKTGIIERSRSFYDLPRPVQKFILLHELGHFKYKTEEYCDLFALVNFLKDGENRSMAFYSLDKVLKKSKAKQDRLKALLEGIQETQTQKI